MGAQLNLTGRLAEFQSMLVDANGVARGRTGEIVQLDKAQQGNFMRRSLTLTNPEKWYTTYLNRSVDDKMANNYTRELFQSAVSDFFGGSIPESVKKAMKWSDFDGKGRPLTIRRIQDTFDAISRFEKIGEFEREISEFTPFVKTNGDELVPANEDQMKEMQTGLKNFLLRSSVRSRGRADRAALALHLTLGHIDNLLPDGAVCSNGFTGLNFSVRAGENPIKKFIQVLLNHLGAGEFRKGTIQAKRPQLQAVMEDIKHAIVFFSKEGGVQMSHQQIWATKALEAVCDFIEQKMFAPPPSRLRSAKQPDPQPENKPEIPLKPKVGLDFLESIDLSKANVKVKDLHNEICDYADHNTSVKHSSFDAKDGHQNVGYVLKHAVLNALETKDIEDLEKSKDIPVLKLDDESDFRNKRLANIGSVIDKVVKDVWTENEKKTEEEIVALLKPQKDPVSEKELEGLFGGKANMNSNVYEVGEGDEAIQLLSLVVGDKPRQIDKIIINRVYEEFGLAPIFDMPKSV